MESSARMRGESRETRPSHSRRSAAASASYVSDTEVTVGTRLFRRLVMVGRMDLSIGK